LHPNLKYSIMKHNFRLYAIGLTALSMVFFAGCKDKEPESLIGTVEKPSWTVPSDYDMTASMTAIVNVDLSLSFPKQIKDAERAVADDDLLAAFVGDVCVGTASPVSGLFFLYIAGTVSGTENPEVSLRYYSSILKNTFVSVLTFPFRNDENIGTVSNPYSPEFVVLKAK